MGGGDLCRPEQRFRFAISEEPWRERPRIARRMTAPHMLWVVHATVPGDPFVVRIASTAHVIARAYTA